MSESMVRVAVAFRSDDGAVTGRLRGHGVGDYGVEVMSRTLAENMKLKSTLVTLE
jgi:hypothetical protein